jgi:hypothetical protein
MPAMTAVTGSGNAAGARGGTTELCAGRAGIVQHAADIVQPSATPCCESGHPGQGVPELTPGWIAAVIPTFETA